MQDLRDMDNDELSVMVYCDSITTSQVDGFFNFDDVKKFVKTLFKFTSEQLANLRIEWAQHF